jgi:glycolate oxidase iron-sulfur subunit
MKDMLENRKVPDEKTVLHIDRCLSCLSCMTTCPSGVHYMHLVDYAREYIERNYKRPWDERALRWLLTKILPYPGRFRLALFGAKLVRPFRVLLPDPRLRAMLEMAPARIPPASANDSPQTFPAAQPRRRRVALLTGCAQRTLNIDINDATIRLLQRHGCEVVIPKGIGCCGALTHHMGRSHESHAFAAANIRALVTEIDGEGLDAAPAAAPPSRSTATCSATIR